MGGSTLFDPVARDSLIHQSAIQPEKELPKTTDTVIVGAGIIGLTTAFRLKQAGRQVILLDPQPAGEATRAAAGMLAPASEVQFCQEALVPLMKHSAALYIDFALEIEEKSGVSVGLRTTETLVCAYDSADYQALIDLSAYQQRLGLTTQPISTRLARKIEPVLSPLLTGAIKISGDHQINPRNLATALQTYLAQDIYPVTATGIETETHNGTVHATGVKWTKTKFLPGQNQKHQTPPPEAGRNGTITATHIVLANGMGTLDLHGIKELTRLPLRPVHGDVLRLRIPENQQPFLESTIRGIVRGNPVYIVPRADNTVVIGASSREDSMTGINAGGIYQLLRDAKDLIPAITELEIYEIISRARPGTPDDLPLIGAIYRNGKPIKNLTLSNGYFRHGILLSARGSELVTNLITNKLTPQDHHDLTNCNPHRFES